MVRVRLLALLAVVLIAGCGDSDLLTSDSQTVTFLHFNDLHAHLTPHRDVVSDPAGEARVVEKGGIARLATLIERERRDSDASVLMNVGDTYHGGAEALFTVGNAIAEPVAALGIDIGVPGNWDFAYGPGVTRLRYLGESALAPPLGFEGEVLRPNFPNLAANVTYGVGDPAGSTGDPFLPANALLEVGGVSVGFIGLTSDIVPRMLSILAFGLEFLQGEDAYRELIDRHASSLRAEGAEIVVVMSELGIQKDYRLAQIIAPGVDVFFSAHTHEVTHEPLTSRSGALVVEAGNDGYLGRMDVTVEDGEVVDATWELLPIDGSIEPDPHLDELVRSARAPFLEPEIDRTIPLPNTFQRLTQPIDTVVGRTDSLLHRRGALENGFARYFTEILRVLGETDAAITPGFRFDAVLGPLGAETDVVATGDVTLEDVYRLFPIPVTISRGGTTGADLRAVVESLLTNVFSPDAFSQSGGWVDGFSGLEIDVDLSRPDHDRVLEMRLRGTGEVVTDERALTLTGCSRPVDTSTNLCSHPGFVDVEPFVNPKTGERWTPVDIFIEGLKTVPPPQGETFSDTAATPLWPTTPFVQPLEGVGAR